MKQIIQSYNTGILSLAKMPAPALKPNTILVRTVASLVSVGTERYMIDLAKKSLAGKALARPDLVRQVINKVRAEGLAEAYRQTMGRLDAPVPLGYSAAGIVSAVGDGVTNLKEGDRVACAGSGFASHAEVLRVPKTLAVKIPDNVSFEAAAFVALGGIAMHSVRMAEVTCGERVVVLGLGLLGQLGIQILNSMGCRVFGVDVSEGKVAMALDHGAHGGAVIDKDDAVSAVRVFTHGYGADAVIVFASADSNQPIELAAEVARAKGRIVVPGLVGLDLPRKTFYEKELNFVVSRAWGAGMYDPDYEAGKLDYPLPFVRWTAGRNMENFLELLGAGRVTVDYLITHRFPIEQSVHAYEMILSGNEPVIGAILQYSPDQVELTQTIHFNGARNIRPSIKKSGVSVNGKDLTPRKMIRVGLVGAGLFAKGTLLPAIKNIEGVKIQGVATSTGISAEHIGRKLGASYCTTDVDTLLDDPEIDLVMILTRHKDHADLVSRVLCAGKHVFVEKPLALNEAQLTQVITAYQQAPGQLMVGFNRRFAPTTNFAVKHLARVTRPLMINIRANVGHIPPEVWVHDMEQGGGNIIGEACHFVDLIQALTGSSPINAFARSVNANNHAIVNEDNVNITLSMADGSIGSIIYSALGDKAYQRERVEVFGGGAVCTIENFKTAAWSQNGRRLSYGNILSGVDRGHQAEMKILIESLRQGKPFPVRFDEYIATTRATFAAVESLRTQRVIEVQLL